MYFMLILQSLNAVQPIVKREMLLLFLRTGSCICPDKAIYWNYAGQEGGKFEPCRFSLRIPHSF